MLQLVSSNFIGGPVVEVEGDEMTRCVLLIYINFSMVC